MGINFMTQIYCHSFSLDNDTYLDMLLCWSRDEKIRTLSLTLLDSQQTLNIRRRKDSAQNQSKIRFIWLAMLLAAVPNKTELWTCNSKLIVSGLAILSKWEVMLWTLRRVSLELMELDSPQVRLGAGKKRSILNRSDQKTLKRQLWLVAFTKKNKQNTH